MPLNRNVSTNSAVESYGDCPSQGRCQIVTAGGGAPSYGLGENWFIETSSDGLHYVKTEVFNDSLIIMALDTNNTIIDSFSIVKNFKVDIDASTTVVCDIGPVTLEGKGADNYVWDNNIQNGVPFTPAETKTYTLIGTNSTGCVDTAAIEIAVNQPTSVTDSYSICSGDSLLIRGKYYKTAGVFFDSLLTIHGCDSILKLDLDLFPAPPEFEISGATQVDKSQKEVYSVPENDSYLNDWGIVNGLIVSESNSSIEIHWLEPGPGYIHVVAENQYGCRSGDVLPVTVIEESPNAIELEENQNIVVYPNPTNSLLNIEYQEEFSIKIYNIIGEQVKVSNSSQIDISSLKPGMYILRIMNPENQLLKTSKFLKK